LNFFEAQDKARRNTLWLVLLFTLAVAGLILLTNLFLLSVYVYLKTEQFVVSPETLSYFYSWEEFAVVALGVCLLVLGGSLFKALSLSGGGPTIAEMLGGRLVSHGTTDLQQRQLLNVVEEMAIAAGIASIVKNCRALSRTSSAISRMATCGSISVCSRFCTAFC
jgi:energy-coupling factor transporter transmembrane protein EcfT